MSIFRRKPKFKVGDRVMVTSLLGYHEWLRPLVGERGSVGKRLYLDGEWRYLGWLDDGTSVVYFHEWELRPA